MLLNDFIARIAASILFGFATGVERQITGHPAGIRTNVLVCLGACIFALAATFIGAPDDTRIASQIVTGIGFLCSGIIFKESANVRGLITSATIWCTGAIGVLSSTGYIMYAGIATSALICANTLSRLVADRINYSTRFDETAKSYIIYVTCPVEQATRVRAAITEHISKQKSMLYNLSSTNADSQVKLTAKLRYHGVRKDEQIEKMLSDLSEKYDVMTTSWELM